MTLKVEPKYLSGLVRPVGSASLTALWSFSLFTLICHLVSMLFLRQTSNTSFLRALHLVFSPPGKFDPQDTCKTGSFLKVTYQVGSCLTPYLESQNSSSPTFNILLSIISLAFITIFHTIYFPYVSWLLSIYNLEAFSVTDFCFGHCYIFISKNQA